MSDLQCPTTVIVLPAGAAIDIELLRRERPALLVSGSDEATEPSEALGLTVRTLADGEPTAVGHLTSLLGEVADQYRGECVVVVVPGEVFTQLRGQVLPVGSAATGALVRVDDDGHRWTAWPSAAPE